MKRLGRSILTGAVLGGVFLLGSLLRSRDSQAKGAYATPVTVTNTNSQPGSVLDSERAMRIPYQSEVALTACSGLTQCNFLGFSGPPAGYRLVVENVSGFFHLATSSPPLVGVLVNSNPPQFNHWGLSASLGGQPFDAFAYAGLNQNVRAYFDFGEVPSVSLIANFVVGFPQDVNLSGYLENCALTGCPAVKH